MKVYKTNQYSRFSYVKGNRGVDEAHVRKLERSILANNLLAQRPILVNDGFQIIDGQHRFEVAKRNKLTVYFVVLDDANIDEVLALNNAQKNWGLRDYINLWIAKGRSDYEILLLFVDTYNLPIGLSLGLLGAQDRSDGIQAFKDGKLRIHRVKDAEQVGEALKRLRLYTKAGLWRSKAFIRAISTLLKVPSFSLDRLIKKMANAKPLEAQTSVKNYLRALEDVYNFKVREKNYLRFT